MYTINSELVSQEMKTKIMFTASAIRALVKPDLHEYAMAGMRFKSDEQVFQAFCQKFVHNHEDAAKLNRGEFHNELPDMVEKALISAAETDYDYAKGKDMVINNFKEKMQQAAIDIHDGNVAYCCGAIATVFDDFMGEHVCSDFTELFKPSAREYNRFSSTKFVLTPAYWMGAIGECRLDRELALLFFAEMIKHGDHNETI